MPLIDTPPEWIERRIGSWDSEETWPKSRESRRVYRETVE